MSHVRMAAALTIASLVMGLVAAVPARAEFFGCNDRPGKVLSDSSWHRGASRQTSHTFGIFTSQPRHQRVIYSSAARYSHYR
ncbi:MAG TPA: hypothetical protein VHL13_01010 [Pseudolabrys sp.]|jgi:hypothetical protein|nr:hypothetical protein [Pseudolabrys sp.]